MSNLAKAVYAGDQSRTSREDFSVPRRRHQLVDRRRIVGLSQESLAERLDVDRSTVVRWERGETTPHPWLRPRLAQALGVSVEGLAGLLDGTADQFLSTSGSATPADTLPGPETTDRREVLTAAVGLAGTALAGEHAVCHHASKNGARTNSLPLDTRIVDHFTSLRRLLVDSDDRLGAIYVLPTVQQQLGLIARLRRRARGALHDQLLGLEAKWAEFAGWLNDDLGDRAAGAVWLSRATALAKEANDHEMSTYLFARKAQRAASSENNDRLSGLGLAPRVDSGNGHTHAFLLVQHALAQAAKGEAYMFESAIAAARSFVEDGPAQRGELGEFCTIPYVLAHEGMGWLRLAAPKSATSCFSRALETWPPSNHRDRALCLARAAMAYLDGGEPEQAATTALEALRLAETAGSARIGREVVTLSHRVTGLSHLPAVSKLIEATSESTIVAS